jgi:leader peptidase (prepilin peptidase) / N-methyltransferase
VNAAAAAFVLAPALALGSFLNVVVVRVPARRSLVRPPSSCGSCGKEILWRDNIPVLSYLLLRGRCRHCDRSISVVYSLVEALTAALIVSCVAVFGPTPRAALAAGFCAVLVTLAVIDATHRIMPNRIVLPAAGVALVAHTAMDPSLAWLAWSLAGAGALFLVVLAGPRGLGMGDVKLALLLGAVLGASVTVALLVGLLAALVPAAIPDSRPGDSARKTGVPLAPFLALGAVVSLFLGEAALDTSRGLF